MRYIWVKLALAKAQGVLIPRPPASPRGEGVLGVIPPFTQPSPPFYLNAFYIFLEYHYY